MVLGKEKKITLCNVPFNNVPEENFEAVILSMVSEHTVKRAIIIDYKTFFKEKKAIKKGIPSLTRDADLVFTTSRALSKAAASLYKANEIRVYPFSLVINILGILEKRALSAYFLGGTSKEIQTLFSNIQSSFPGLKIVGRYKGDYPKNEEEFVLTGIKKAGPSFLLIGTRINKPDQWLASQQKQFKGGLIISSPEAFKIICGKKKPIDEKKALIKSDFKIGSLLRPWRWFKYWGFKISIMNEKNKNS